MENSSAVFQNVKHRVCDPTMLSLSMYPKELKTTRENFECNGHSSIIHSNQKVKIAQNDINW